MTATVGVQTTAELVADVSDLSVVYRSGGRDLPVLRDVSLRIHAGAALAVVGESGCGKSTLAGALVGYLRAGSRVTAGSVRIGGEDILTASRSKLLALRREQVGFVPQNAGHSLTPSMRVGAHVVEVLRTARGMGRAAARAEAVKLFRQVRLPQPEVLVDRYPHQLSGGQQQRVAIAVALAGQPRLLVLDEPTTGLDVVTKAGVLDLFARLRAELGIALVLVSHDLGAVAAVCERIAVMYAGRVVESGDTATTFRQPSHPYTRGLLSSLPRLRAPGLPVAMAGNVPSERELAGCAFAPRCSFAGDSCTHGEAPPLVNVPGRDGASACLWTPEVLAAPAWEGAVRVRQPRTQKAPLLEVRGLTVDYRRRPDPGSGPTVSDVDLVVHRGEVVALVGESGSGKSTIAWTIAGLRRPTSGQVTLLDGTSPADLTRVAARRDPAVRRQVQLIFQNAGTALNPRRTVGDAISRPLRLRGLRREAARAARDEALRDVGLDQGHADRLPAQLSGGQQQRVGIARAIAAGPTLVLADEVVSALDVSVQASVLGLLDDLREEHHLGYLFISHDLAVVRGIADRVVVLYLGRVCEEGPVERVLGPVDAAGNHPYTRLLVASVLAAEPGVRGPVPAAGDEPESAPPAAGCPFRRRCPHRIDPVCDVQTPPWQDLGDGHRIRCHVPAAELRTGTS
ncbi:MAG TPA: dipeptide ABC transporter ATP-binding protein [Actinoplanes sp.]|nr:dipeptide ABC transporter ATP-binding protein [Actinoplanes sp.]